jgi:hypothetical protein
LQARERAGLVESFEYLEAVLEPVLGIGVAVGQGWWCGCEFGLLPELFAQLVQARQIGGAEADATVAELLGRS